MSASDYLQPLQFRFEPANKSSRLNTITAHHPSSDSSYGGWDHYVGHLSWDQDDGEIYQVQTHPDFARKGVASTMLKTAKEKDSRVHHSDSLSDAGKSWSEARPV